MILVTTLPRKRPPSTPGEILLEDFLRPMGLTQAQLATRTGLGPRCVNEICRGKRAITPRTAILLSDEFGTTVEFWITLQNSTDLWREIESMGRLAEIPSAPVLEKKKVRSTPSKNVPSQKARKTKNVSAARSHPRTA
jgi:addiction module HigA family antidote